MENISTYGSKIIDMALVYAPKLAMAIGVLVIGFWIIKKIGVVINASLTKANFSDDIRPFLVSMLDGAMKVMLLFSVAGIVGIETASFVAVLAAAGFAVGMALQGSLGNFAAGIIIILFKPYKIGDWVEVHDKFGKVEEVQIFNSIIVTPGQKTLIIPNGKIIDGIVTNFSRKGLIRMELKVTMPYAQSFPRVQGIIMEAIKDIPEILKTPAPEIGIEDYESHNLVVGVRPYTTPDNYWEVKFETYKRIKAAFHDNKIQVAYSEGVELGSIGE